MAFWLAMTTEIEDWYQKAQLHFAAQEGDLRRVTQLLDDGSDLRAFDEIGKTPLHYAAKEEHFAVVELLLKRGADVNAHHEPSISNTPLADIAESCSLQMAELLISAGADPTIPGWMQLNAIHRAERRKDEEGRRVHDLLLQACIRRFYNNLLNKGFYGFNLPPD